MPIPVQASVFLSHLNPQIIDLALNTIRETLQLRPASTYASSQLSRSTFSHVTNRLSHLKKITGKVFDAFVSQNTLRCETAVSSQAMRRRAWQEALYQSFHHQTTRWNFFSQRYKQQELRSKEFYLHRCTYYILDPHMDDLGVRRKTMKVVLPSIEYECARVRKEDVEKDAKDYIQQGNGGMRDYVKEVWKLGEDHSPSLKLMHFRRSVTHITNSYVD